MSYIFVTSRSVLPSCYSFYIRYATKNGNIFIIYKVEKNHLQL